LLKATLTAAFISANPPKTVLQGEFSIYLSTFRYTHIKAISVFCFPLIFGTFSGATSTPKDVLSLF
jgi:hypothetical protein